MLTAALAAASATRANAELIYGVSDPLNELISFNSATPQNLISAMGITGLLPDDQVRAIDWVNGTLYGLGNSSHLYTINPATANATLVSVSQFGTLLNGTDFGMAYAGGSLWVSSDLTQNQSVNPITGVATPGPNYATGGIDSMLYDSANSTFYGVNNTSSSLFAMNPATGATTLIGPTGAPGLFLNELGMTYSSATGTAYVAQDNGSSSYLFTENLATGALTLVNSIGTGPEIQIINTITVASVPEPETIALMATAGGLGLLRFLRRKA